MLRKHNVSRAEVMETAKGASVNVTPEEETRLACVTKKVEESVIEKKKVKLSRGKGRTYTRVQRRPESYAAGKRDSSHIDLQQRTLA